MTLEHNLKIFMWLKISRKISRPYCVVISVNLSWASFVCLRYFPWKLTSTQTEDFIHFVEFSCHQFVDLRRKMFLKFVNVGDEVQNVFVKKWAVSSVEDQCRMQKTNSIERKTGAERPQTAWSEQNYRHVTELISSQEGNTESSRGPRKMINLTAISLSSGCCEKLS